MKKSTNHDITLKLLNKIFEIQFSSTPKTNWYFGLMIKSYHETLKKI